MLKIYKISSALSFWKKQLKFLLAVVCTNQNCLLVTVTHPIPSTYTIMPTKRKTNFLLGERLQNKLL